MIPPVRSSLGLSEVIGFVLIVGILAIAASLYLAYAVPAQGREAEIRQMDYIRDQFSMYKTSLDALWVNRETNITLSQSIRPGTTGGQTQGSFLTIPIFQPAGSSGTFAINQKYDQITISAPQARWSTAASQTGTRSDVLTLAGSPVPLPIPSPPSHMYLTLVLASVSPPPAGGVIVTGQNWSVDVRAVRPPNSTADLSARVTVIRPNYTISQEVIIARNISAGTYSTDLVNIFSMIPDIAGSISYPSTITLVNTNSTALTAQYQTEYPYISQAYGISHPMGSFSFQSQNNYWISQNYYYQSGAVFLRQDSGAAVQLMPPITLGRRDNQTAVLKITDITLQGTGSLGGSGPVQVLTRLNSTRPWPLATGVPNAANVTIQISSEDPVSARLWNATFDRIRRIATDSGVPPAWSSTPVTSGNTTSWTIDGPLTSTQDDIILEVTDVSVMVSLQPVAL